MIVSTSSNTLLCDYFGIRINPSPLTIIFNLSLRGFKVFLSNFFPISSKVLSTKAFIPSENSLPF